ncbi:hypothetical protein CKM354_000576700 [Cercospora kikuchii]|uniref:Uncharacterized protein n=1 Tax=Cercospora kikuchii TaxID=84275 RepID=A0A9P3CI75_9PEZI|nr:uncharacterized protein CKM354_000576700 [Cercospora kikuchii]GIZ42501.1 hypothetical protein CKM354_000576700 [Cercospora kikuchii]
MTQIKDSPEVKAIKALIQAFFDAINAADIEGLGTYFAPEANLTIIRQEPPRAPSSESTSSYPQFAVIPSPAPTSAQRAQTDAKESLKVVIRTDIAHFLALLEEGRKRREGQPDLQIFEKPDLERTEVKVDALFAMAWCPFSVTFAEKLHHYGTLVFTVGKEAEEAKWKIEGLTQNYRRSVGWEGEKEFM